MGPAVLGDCSHCCIYQIWYHNHHRSYPDRHITRFENHIILTFLYLCELMLYGFITTRKIHVFYLFSSLHCINIKKMFFILSVGQFKTEHNTRKSVKNVFSFNTWRKVVVVFHGPMSFRLMLHAGGRR